MPVAVSLCQARPWAIKVHKPALATHRRDSMDKIDLFIPSQGLFVQVFFSGVAVVYLDATKKLDNVLYRFC